MQTNYVSVSRSIPRSYAQSWRSCRFSLLIAVLTLAIIGPQFAPAATDWPTFGFDVQRTGENPFESTITPSTVGGLHQLWNFDLGAVTIMQPVLATGVVVNGAKFDLVYMGAEHGDLYAIDAVSGAQVWHRNLGSQKTECADIPDEIFGVTGSLALDTAQPNVRSWRRWQTVRARPFDRGNASRLAGCYLCSPRS